MMMLSSYAMLMLFITSTLMFLASMISKKSFHDREKLSPFECGFNPKKSPRMAFSLHFFLIAMIFLIFDIEISLLIPMVVIFKNSQLNILLYMSFFFFLILLIGLYYEWNQGALNWLF